MHTGSQMARDHMNMKDLMADMALERLLWAVYLTSGGDPTAATTSHVDCSVGPKEAHHD